MLPPAWADEDEAAADPLRGLSANGAAVSAAPAAAPSVPLPALRSAAGRPLFPSPTRVEGMGEISPGWPACAGLPSPTSADPITPGAAGDLRVESPAAAALAVLAAVPPALVLSGCFTSCPRLGAMPATRACRQPNQRRLRAQPAVFSFVPLRQFGQLPCAWPAPKVRRPRFRARKGHSKRHGQPH